MSYHRAKRPRAAAVVNLDLEHSNNHQFRKVTRPHSMFGNFFGLAYIKERGAFPVRSAAKGDVMRT